MNPLTKLVWFNEQDKKLWEPRIAEISKTYNSAELATVIMGMRRVYVYHVYSTNFEQSYEFLNNNDLLFYPTNKSGIYQGFSHTHTPVEEGKPYMMYGAAVKSNDRTAGELFTKYSKSKPVNHSGIGKLLGYPKCCIDFFQDNWSKISIDPMYEVALNTEGAIQSESGVTVKSHPYCNDMLRYFGIRITPHIPHSFQCEATIKWGDEWMDIMKQLNGDAAEWAKELLSMPLTWSCLKGVAIVETPIFRGITNSDNCHVKKTVINTGY